MDAVTALTHLGGVARWRELRRRVSARAIHAAVADGRFVRISLGTYALPSVDEGRALAVRLSAVLSHTNAANHWGWPVKIVPTRPHVTVGRQRRLSTAQREGVVVHVRDLAATEVVDDWVTSRERTVIDCCLDLPWDEALAVFDSSWRSGLPRHQVQAAARGLPPRQLRRFAAVADAADRRADNPFESVLRSIATTVPGLAVVPQLRIVTSGRAGPARFRVDLGDADLKVVLEADSFEFHGRRSALDADCRRYDRLTVDGWLVLRFSWEMVMFEPALVRNLISDAVDRAHTVTGRKRAPRPARVAIAPGSALTKRTRAG